MNRLVKLVFILLISLPILDIAFNLLPANTNNENRDLGNTKLSFISLKDVNDWLKAYDNNFNGRSLLIKWFLGFKKLIPGNSPLPQKVVLGKNGYYYLVNYNSMDDYRNNNPWKEGQLEALVLKLQDQQNYLAKKGIPYVIVIVPEKQKIYPEYLSDNITKVSEVSRMDQFKKYIYKQNTSLDIIDFTEVLKANKKDTLYFKKESHWNYYGAFLCYRKLMSHVSKKYNVSYDSTLKYEFKSYQEIDLDLAKIMGESYYASESTVIFKTVDSIYKESFDPGFYVSDYVKKKNRFKIIGIYNPKEQKKLLMFRDSYAAFWTDLFSNNFQYSAFVWKYDFDTVMINQFKPDIVIQEVAERHLDYLNYTK